MLSNRDDKKIAKNTVYLYIRMGFTMLLGIYTSRIVLKALGETDFGLHNVVAGVVLMLVFLNGTLVASTQRYLNMAIGEKSSQYICNVFKASVRIHLVLTGVIFILAETIGFWFLNTHMNIPANRMFAANLVYQFSIISFCFTINQSPLQAMIISREQMGVYAMVSVFDIVARFLLALYVLYTNYDRLIVYGLSLMVVTSLDYIIYRYYCYHKYEECKIKTIVIEKRTYKSLLSFSGWALIGSLAYSLLNQGVNILLNIYFGPVVNAARGLAMTVNNCVFLFVSNFTTAINPQLIKTYASSEYESMYDLLLKSIKFSLFLYSFISLPLLFETSFVLDIWLEEVPLYTIIFSQIILLESFLLCAERPLVTACNGIGCVKEVNLTVGIMYCLAFFLSWVLLAFTHIVIIPFIVHLVVVFVGVLFFMHYVKKYINIHLSLFVSKVLFRFLCTIIVPIILLLLIRMRFDEGWFRLFLTIVISSVSLICMVFLVGMEVDERSKIRELMYNHCRPLKISRLFLK